MNLKTLIAAFTLAVIPGLSFAQCSQVDKVEQQAMSCIPGTQWDATTSSCVPAANS